MATLTIRNVEDAVVDALKQNAAANRRSLEAEVRRILADHIKVQQSGQELRSLAERIAAMTPDVPQTDSAELLREERDR